VAKEYRAKVGIWSAISKILNDCIAYFAAERELQSLFCFLLQNTNSAVFPVNIVKSQAADIRCTKS